jgi:hypothetical protein
MKSYILFIVLVMSVQVFSQSAEEQKVKFELGGFVRTDALFDSRQTISLRDNAIMIAPAPESMDKYSQDINAAPNLTMFALHTRLSGKATGIEALGAKVTGYLEGEFFGLSDNDINGFRLRHSFVRFDWENTSILFGQFWHPMFSTDVIPSFSFAAPFIPYSRNPQLRVTQKLNNYSLSFTALTQRDFTSSGPDEKNNSFKSNTFLKNSYLPMLDLQLQAKYDNLFLGAGADYKSLVPRLRAQDGTKTDERINSYAFTVYGKVTPVRDVTLKFQGVYGQNLSDITIAGGYAISAVDSTKFTNLNTLTAWSELSYGSNVTYNLFIGYSKNLGSDKNTNGKYFGFLNNMDNLIRIAPNVSFIFSKMKITTELDYSKAVYGDILKDKKSDIGNRYNVDNYRFCLSCTYMF